MFQNQGAVSLLHRAPSLSYLTVAHANVAGITIPSTAQPGDLAVLVDTPIGSVNPTLVIPAGFTSVYDFNGSASSNLRASFSGKILATGDPGASITGMTGNVASRKSVMIFRPNSRPFSVLTGGGGTGTITDGDPAARTIALANLPIPIVAIGVSFASAAVDVSSSQMTVLATDVATRSLLYSVLRNNATDQQFDASDVGVNNTLAGCYFTLR